MTGPGTRLNAVCNGILAALATIEDPTVSLVDSNLAGSQPKRNEVVVGIAVDTIHLPAERAAHRYNDQLTVTCKVLSTSGTKSIAGRRQKMSDLMDAIEAAILADQTLGGVCYDAYLGECHYNYDSDTEGADAEADFVIIAHQGG